MTETDFETSFDPVLAQIRERSEIEGGFLDKDLFRIQIAILWANVVVDPRAVGLGESDLEPFHDWLDGRVRTVLGGEDRIRGTYRWLLSTDGEEALRRARVPAPHREFLFHLGRLMLDPAGLARRLGELREPS